MVAYCSSTRRIAFGGKNGNCVVHDLRATKAQVRYRESVRDALGCEATVPLADAARALVPGRRAGVLGRREDARVVRRPGGQDQRVADDAELSGRSFLFSKIEISFLVFLIDGFSR